jgi:hypothetical protein
VIRARELSDEIGLTRYGQGFRENTTVLAHRELSGEELLLLSERYNVELRQTVIRQTDGTLRVEIGAGTRGQTTAPMVLPGERVIRDWHTHPGDAVGHIPANRSSAADYDVARSTGTALMNISRNRQTGEVVWNSALPMVP